MPGKIAGLIEHQSSSHAYLAQHRDKLRQYVVEYVVSNGGQ